MADSSEKKIIPYLGAGYRRPLTAEDETSISILLDFLHSESSDAAARTDGLVASGFPDYLVQEAIRRFKKSAKPPEDTPE